MPNPKIYAGTEHEQTVNPQRWHAESPRHVVQQHYVNARTHDINVNQGDRLQTESAALFREFFADRLRGLAGKQKDQYCQDAYQRLTRVLQSRDVTINFKARNWFSRENTYESFAQMYEKAIQANGKMVLDNSDKLNPAMARTATDDSITFPQAWNTAQANQPLHRGLRPGQQSPQRIMGRMMGGKHLMPSMMADIPDDNLTEISPGRYQSPNLRFNPKTKQVFAALNYGRRPHGSSTQYGKSFFILKPSVKVNAIYYAGDTFQVTTGANAQVSYQNLAAVFLKALPGMRESLRSSCFLAGC